MQLSSGTKIDDLGWPWTAISSNYLGILQDFADMGANSSRKNEDRPIYRHRRNCSPFNVLFTRL